MELPCEILNLVADDARPAVGRWWSSLTDIERQDMANQWDERHEAFFFAPTPDSTGRVDDWDQLPGVIGGQFVPHDSNELPEWAEEWYEYVVSHEEMMAFYVPILVIRTFHICQAEPAAQAVTSLGMLPSDFCCPIGAVGCPMKRIQGVAPGKDLHLAPATAGGWWVVAPWRGPKPRPRQGV